MYHVTSRGDRREPIAKDDSGRTVFLDVLGQALERFDAQTWAYCLMGNHYHPVLHTREANLSRLMRQINGVYTQAFNRHHSLTGHGWKGWPAPALGPLSSVKAWPHAGCPQRANHLVRGLNEPALLPHRRRHPRRRVHVKES